jgi:uncharacterized protein (TIGR03083 family)
VRCDPIPTIRREADAFLAAARRGLEAQVPGCPEWTVRELTHHVGVDYLWHARHIVRGETSEPEEWQPELPPDDELLEWFDECCNELLITLRSTDPELPAWNWAPRTAQKVAWWLPRLAIETAVHRWDAESAHRDAHGIDLDVALDGIDEMVTVIGPAHTKPDFPTGTIVIRPTDDETIWAVRLAPETFELIEHAPSSPDAVIEGTTTALLLAFWGRDADYTMTGDPALAAVLT